MNLQNATWYSPLQDGRMLIVQASLRPRHGRAAVKFQLPSSASASQRHLLEQGIQRTLHLARLNEATAPDNQQQLLLEFNLLPADTERDWELALVMADRSVRGLYSYPAERQLFACGHANDWATGELIYDPATLAQLTSTMRLSSTQHWVLPAALVAALPAPLQADAKQAIRSSPQLATLCAQIAPGPLLVKQTCYFPLIGAPSLQLDHASAGQHAHGWLGRVDLVLRAQLADPDGATSQLTICGLDAPSQLQAQEVLQEARAGETRPVQEWRGLAAFSLDDAPTQAMENTAEAPTDSAAQFRLHDIVGNSWQLALVLADRIARGRAFPAVGRVIASGCSTRWHTGQIDSVAGAQQKCALLLDLAMAGDRIILPHAWRSEIPDVLADFLPRLAEKGASCVLPSRLALW